MHLWSVYAILRCVNERCPECKCPSVFLFLFCGWEEEAASSIFFFFPYLCFLSIGHTPFHKKIYKSEKERQETWAFPQPASHLTVPYITSTYPPTEAKRVVRDYRGQLYAKVRGLDDVAFDLEVRTRDLTWRFDRAAAILQDHEPYRWYTGLGESLGVNEWSVRWMWLMKCLDGWRVMTLVCGRMVKTDVQKLWRLLSVSHGLVR